MPFTSPYRTFWLGLGTVAFDLLLAVVLTSLLRVRLGYRAWRAVHWLGYACWPVALWHGLGTGTDSRLPWLLALDAVCVAAVTGALGWRLSLAAPPAGRLATSALACAALPAATVAFVAVGPLQPGWARRAGHPGHAAGRPGGPRGRSGSRRARRRRLPRARRPHHGPGVWRRHHHGHRPDAGSRAAEPGHHAARDAG